MFSFLFYLCFSVNNQFNFLFFVFALRLPPPQSRVSESSDLTDPLDELPRVNSDTALEAISGVQPELQSTRNDSEIYSKFFSFFVLILFFISHSNVFHNDTHGVVVLISNRFFLSPFFEIRTDVDS